MFVSQLASCLWRNLGLYRSSEKNIDPAKYDRRTHGSWCLHAKHIMCNNKQDAAAIRILGQLVIALVHSVNDEHDDILVFDTKMRNI